MVRAALVAMLCLGAPLLLPSCASLNDERAQVRAMALERLDCPQSWLGPHIEEADDSPVRHWSASCNHRALRITCSHEGCSEDVQRPRLLCDSPFELFTKSDGGIDGATEASPSSQVQPDEP
jgi:hypothetical protein